MTAHLEVDTASWSPAVLAAAQQMGARAICFYAYDPDVSAADGDRNDAGEVGSGPGYYCGGWTPAVVARIRAAGLVPRPIFGFRPASGLPTYERCLQILQLLGIRRGEVVLTDREADLTPTVAFQTGWNQLLGEQGYVPGVYGNEATLNDGCLAYANAVWLANWGDSPAWEPAPDLAAIPAFDKWATRSWQFCHDQLIDTPVGSATVDVSISSFAVPDAPAPDPPAAPAPADPPPAPLQEDSMDRLVISAYPNPSANAQAVVNLDRGTFWVMEGPDLPQLEKQGIPVCELQAATLDSQFTRLKAPA